MPSKVFFNLKKEKQEKITRAAINEFTNYVYEEVQVKRIVEEAGIARGSFYQYFEGIEDLFIHVLKYIKQTIIMSQKHHLVIDPELDAFDVLKQNFLMRLNESLKEQQFLGEFQLLQKVRESEHAINIFIETVGLIPDTGNNQIIELLLQQYSHLEEKQLSLIAEILFPGIKLTIERLLRKEIEVPQAIEEIEYKFSIIKYGIKGE